MKRYKRFLAMVLAVATLFGVFTIGASAAETKKALPSLSSSKYIQCYTLKSSGTVQAYTSSSLTTKKSGYTITCSTDECRIVAVSGNAVKVSYPLDQGGRSTQWFKRSDFTATNISGKLTVKKTTAQITTYRRSDGKKTYGYAGKGDEIYVLGTSGSYTQIVYELSSGQWKMGWIKTSDANTYLKDVTSSSSSGDSYTAAVNAFINNDAWKNGITWSDSQTPKLSSYSSKGCCAYAADFVKYVFDADSPRGGTRFTDVSAIKAGDILHLSPNHWIVVLSRDGNNLQTAEGNVSGKVVISSSRYTISGNSIVTKSTTYTIADGYHFQ